MNREQFMRKFDKEVAELDGRRPKLLLHSCCGPCSGSVIELLCRFFDVTVLWYNPNLWPEEEFELRLETQKKLMEILKRLNEEGEIVISKRFGGCIGDELI